MATTYTQFAQLPVPDENAADDVPYWLTQLADALDTTSVLRASSAADRDARFYNCPAGVICAVVQTTPSVSVLGVYVKTSAAGTATWGTIWQPPAANTWTPFTLGDAYTSRTPGVQDPGIWQENSNFYVCKGELVRIDGTNFTQGNVVAWLPTGFTIPNDMDFPAACTLSNATAGESKLYFQKSSGAIMWYGAGNVTWISFHGIRIPTF